VAAGNLADMVPFRLRGWDVVVGQLSESAAQALRGLGADATRLGDDRYHLVLPPAMSPDEVIASVSAGGGRLISLNPIRDTLEDFFVARVRQTDVPVGRTLSGPSNEVR
jgi:hypothetical protein